MSRYPIRVNVHLPRSVRRENRAQKAQEIGAYANAIENYINTEMENCDYECRMFSYSDIAHKLEIPKKIVELLLQYKGGGGNGITIVR